MQIAIKFEKINLGEDKFVFKPVCIIKGTYDEESEIFETDYNEDCVPITGTEAFSDNYFGWLTTIDELREMNGPKLTDEELLTDYFEQSKNFYFIGYYDFEQGDIKVLNIPYEYLVESLEDVPKNVESNKDVQITFELSKLKELLQKREPEDVCDALKEFISSVETTLNSNNIPQELIEKEHKEELRVQPDKKTLSLKKEESKGITLKELRKEVKAVIKGQDKAVDDVTRAIIVNQLSNNPKHKSHMLVIGPSGTGKTEMINIISKKMGIPFFKADATAYTKEGYVGKSVYSMFDGLVQSANGDIEKAQKGILIIDEIDKKLSSREDDVGGIDVLNSLLKIMDREVIEIGDGHKSFPYLFDTSNLTIIFMGAFANLYKEKSAPKKRSIGFGSNSKEETPQKVVITNADLIEAGVPPEFLGRIPIVTNTEELTLENLVEILYKSKGGVIEEEKQFCKDLGITIKFTSGYMKEIAKKAQATKTGARNLRKLVRESLSPAYDEILSGKKVKVLKLTKQTALDHKKYYTE